MASKTISVTPTFPVGTSVGAYSRSHWPEGATEPRGLADETAVVQSNGLLSFGSLAPDSAYTAAAQVSGAWRTISFRSDPATNPAVLESELPYFLVTDADFGADPTGATHSDGAFIAARNAASAAGGGVVKVPPGSYTFAGAIGPWPSKVDLEGSGIGCTTLTWPTDIGTTPQALAMNVPVIDASAAGIQANAPHFRNFRMVGTGGQSLSNIGVRACKMDGIALNSNAVMEHVQVESFGAGIVLFSDHTYLADVKSANNYYNVLYPSPRGGKGNSMFVGCVLESAAWACVAVGGNNTIDGTDFIGGHVGSAPYGFYKGDGVLGPSTDGFMTETTLLNLAFEGIGNAAILDESTGAGSGQDSFTGVDIINPGMVWDAGKRIGARAADYAVDVRNSTDLRVRHGSFGFLAGARAVYNFRAGQSHGCVELSTLYSGDTLVDVSGVGLIVQQGGGTWRGRVRQYTGTLVAGDIVEYSGADTVRRLQGGGYAGVCVQAGNGYCVVAEEGLITVNQTSAISPGQYAVPDPATNYKAVGYNVSDNTLVGDAYHYPIIGVAKEAGGGSPASGQIRLAAQGFDPRWVRPAKVSSLPTAAAAYRGQVLRVEGGTGVADQWAICEKKADDTYQWRAL